MRHRRAVLAAALVVLVPAPVLAQAASPGTETRLEMERRQRRAVVRPGIPSGVVENDVEAVLRQQETARDLTRPAPRRPDLDYDVKSGIQSQRLNDALRRR
jgi:hypothetical protein